MNIEIKEEHQITVIALNGRLDEMSAPEVETLVLPLAERSDTRLLIDLSNVEYVSSGGLRVLLMLSKAVARAHNSLRLCGLNPFVNEVMEISHLRSNFQIHQSRELAIAAYEL